MKGTKGVDTFNLAAKSDLVLVKVKIDEIYTEKLKAAPADLSKLSNVDSVIKKTVYDKLLNKVRAIKLPNTTGLVSKTSTIKTNKVLRKRVKMLIRKYVVLMN